MGDLKTLISVRTLVTSPDLEQHQYLDDLDYRGCSYSDSRISAAFALSDFRPVIGAGWYVHLSAAPRRWHRPQTGVTWSQLNLDFLHGSQEGRFPLRRRVGVAADSICRDGHHTAMPNPTRY